MSFYNKFYAIVSKERLNIKDLILKLETKTNKIVKLKTSFEKTQSQLEDRLLL